MALYRRFTFSRTSSSLMLLVRAVVAVVAIPWLFVVREEVRCTQHRGHQSH